MSFVKEVTFHGYIVIANVRRVTADDWAGSYLVEKDGRIVRIRFDVAYRETAKAAAAAALVFGLQFVDQCQITERRQHAAPEMDLMSRAAERQ
jgi:hypothetical protein